MFLLFMKIYKNILIILLVLIPVAISMGQNNLSTENKKAIKKYNDAVVYLGVMREEQAISSIIEAIAQDSNFIEAYQIGRASCRERV